jgi:hypothetical protein
MMKTDTEILDEAALKVSEILGVSVSEIDKIKFIQMYSLLYTIMGGDEELMRYWMRNKNTHLGFCPVDELTDGASFDRILGYLESFL